MPPMQLSWDLHVHPGPSSVPRWGTGAEIQAACARAGVAGFVWKSHEGHTARACRDLPADRPRAIGSASLNAWATPASVGEAIADGAGWVWGPTYREGGVSWELPLPEQWPAFMGLLAKVDRPLVLGTGHLGADGRRALAEFAAGRPDLTCSVTHSLYLDAAEVAELNALGCVFEVDLYTATRAIHDRPRTDLVGGITALRAAGAWVYVTTDCGQKAVGDPYVFSHTTLDEFARVIGDDVASEVAIEHPRELALRVVGGLQ
jgi:hypothetical protein